MPPRHRLLCIALLIPLLGGCLGGCADTRLHKWLTGLPNAEDIAYTGPLAMPATSPQGKPWPNLADVPEKPKPLMSVAEDKKKLAEMTQENAAGEQAIADYNRLNPPPPTPTPNTLPNTAANASHPPQPAGL